RDDQARPEGDVLSLTEATALLEAELKVEGRRRKLAGNISGDYRKKTIGLAVRTPKVAELAGVNRPYPGVRAIELPKSAGKPLVPNFFGYV
ncbi:hypothetical protein B296_00057054, partial [Ensete ventricosum]